MVNLLINKDASPETIPKDKVDIVLTGTKKALLKIWINNLNNAKYYANLQQELTVQTTEA